ncbi:MAG: hypothetical protein WDN69_04825 [Aliidongia sp.]
MPSTGWKRPGIERVIVNVHYLGDIIAEHLAQRSAPEIVIAREATALETGGGVKHAMALLGDEPFFVVNGDSLWARRHPPGPDPAGRCLGPATTDAMLLLQRTATRRRLWRGAGRLHCSSARPAAPAPGPRGGAVSLRRRAVAGAVAVPGTCRTACSR